MTIGSGGLIEERGMWGLELTHCSNFVDWSE